MMVNIQYLEAMTMKLIASIVLFGTHCICLTNAHRSNRSSLMLYFFNEDS